MPFKPETLHFPYLKQIFSIERVRHIKANGKEEREVAYGGCLHAPEQASPEAILEMNRGHWSIENCVHYVRDVTFEEDKSRIRTGNGAHVMAILRNLAIHLLRSRGVKNIAEKIQTFSWSLRELFKFLGLSRAKLRL